MLYTNLLAEFEIAFKMLKYVEKKIAAVFMLFKFLELVIMSSNFKLLT